jgi:enamine deaminase RidA (YjgF/YER057c/UK114 family)
MSTETRLAAKLAQLGLQLPAAPEPKGVYRPLVTLGNLIYTSGHLPVDAASGVVVGRLGAELDVAAGYRAAQLTALCYPASRVMRSASAAAGCRSGRQRYCIR